MNRNEFIEAAVASYDFAAYERVFWPRRSELPIRYHVEWEEEFGGEVRFRHHRASGIASDLIHREIVHQGESIAVAIARGAGEAYDRFMIATVAGRGFIYDSLGE